MKIRFTAENQRRIIVYIYERNAISEDLTEKEAILCLLGDFYLAQNTYTKIMKIEKIENEKAEVIWIRKQKN